MLPILILLFSGTIYLHARGLAGQQTLAAARGCAFQYALQGCPDDPARLSLCRGVQAGKVSEVDAANSAQDGQAAQSTLDEVGQWWLIGDLLRGLFGTGSRAVAHGSLRAFAKDEQRSVTGKLYIVCNTLSEPWANRIKAVTCGVADKIHVGSSLKWLKVCP